MFRLGLLCTAAALVVLIAGCCRERDAAVDDVHRFVKQSEREAQLLAIDVERYAVSNALVAKELPLDVANFIEWRKREWWNLKDELAWHYNQEWLAIEKLTKDVSRYYGYNVQNFPHAKDDVLRFFAHADAEWRNLVQDIIIWREYQLR